MKITEPKTPYVRYNPLTDEVEGGMFVTPWMWLKVIIIIMIMVAVVANNLN